MLNANLFSRAPARRAPVYPLERPSSHERVLTSVPPPGKSAGLSDDEYRQLLESIRTAPAIPLGKLHHPAQKALARSARERLARAAGCRPEDVQLRAFALPGTQGRVLLFSDAEGHQTHGTLAQQRENALARALSELSFSIGAGPGLRIIPGTLSAGATGAISHYAGRAGLVGNARAGVSTSVAGGAWQWEVAPKPTSLGPTVSLSAPFVSVEHCPVMGERVDLSVPGVFTLFAAVSPADESKPETGWIGLVWCQGLLPGPVPGPTVNLKLVVGHPALAAPLGPVVHGASRVMTPIQAIIEGVKRRLGSGAKNGQDVLAAGPRSDEPQRPRGSAAQRQGTCAGTSGPGQPG